MTSDTIKAVIDAYDAPQPSMYSRNEHEDMVAYSEKLDKAIDALRSMQGSAEPVSTPFAYEIREGSSLTLCYAEYVDKYRPDLTDKIKQRLFTAPPAPVSAEPDEFIAQRLRAICERLYVVGIPTDDKALLEAKFSVLGMIQRRVDDLMKPLIPNGWLPDQSGPTRFPSPKDSIGIASPSADSKDSERLDWLDKQNMPYGFEDFHEGNFWSVQGAYSTIRECVDAQMAIAAKEAGK